MEEIHIFKKFKSTKWSGQSFYYSAPFLSWIYYISADFKIINNYKSLYIRRALSVLAGKLSWLGHCHHLPELWVQFLVRHIPESTNEHTSKWNHKSINLSFFLSLSLSAFLSFSKKSIKKKEEESYHLGTSQQICFRLK